MQPPKYIDVAKIAGKPPTFKWGAEVWQPFLDPPGGGAKFFTMNPHASLALAAACAEWIAWRLAPYAEAADSADLFARIEATWAAALDPKLVKKLPARKTKSADKTVDGVMSATSILLERAVSMAKEKSTLIAMATFGLSELAGHVSTKSKVSAWVKATLPTLSKRYPRVDDKRGRMQFEDPEVPVVRAGLDPDASDAAVTAEAKKQRAAWKKAKNPYFA